MNTTLIKGGSKSKRKIKQHDNKNPLEQLMSIGGGVAASVADLGKSAINLDNWDQYLGLAESEEKKKKYQGELTEGEILDLRKIHEKDQTEAKAHAEPGIDYSREIVHAGERMVSRENQELEAQLRELMMEIKKLADTSKELQMQFKDVAVEQHVVKPGKYHKTFFAWLLNVIRTARMKVEDSGAWLAAMQSKKKSRGYQQMAKKHGTTFTLHNERTPATQTG